MSDKGSKSTSRRDFIKTVAGGAAASAATAAAGAAITTGTVEPAEAAKKNEAETGGEKNIQYGMVIDVRRCIGCHSCTVACKSEFDVPLGMNRTWVEYVEKGEYPNVGRSFLPRLCNHCSQPPCVGVCPTGATYKRKEDGVVVVDSGVCIGCAYCILACPYDARFLNPVTRFADKCDFCLHRVSQGVVPSCVNTCIGDARIFGVLSDPDSNISRIIASNRVTVLRREMGTLPNIYYIGADFTDMIDARRPEVREVRVITNRRQKERR